MINVGATRGVLVSKFECSWGVGGSSTVSHVKFVHYYILGT